MNNYERGTMTINKNKSGMITLLNIYKMILYLQDINPTGIRVVPSYYKKFILEHLPEMEKDEDCKKYLVTYNDAWNYFNNNYKRELENKKIKDISTLMYYTGL